MVRSWMGAAAKRRSSWHSRSLVGAALVGCAGMLVACGDSGSTSGGSGTVKSDRVVFADYGGTTRAARKQAFLNPFSRAEGVRAISADADPAKLVLFGESRRADWDLIDMDGWDVDRFMRRGLLKKLPPDVTRVDLVPKTYRDYATAGYNASTGIGYRSDRGDAPRSWGDFFDAARFPGKRAVPSFTYFMAEAALLADGVSCDRLYPLDLDRAFAKLDTIRDDVLVYDSFGQAVQYLAQGSVAMALVPNSRISVLEEQGLSVGFSWDDAFFTWTAAAVPADAPDADAAFALLNAMAEPEAQAEFSRLTKYGPMNSEALELLDDETREQMPNTHLDTACEIDNEGLSADFDKYSERYQKWLAQN
ncbi:extracellular solute-binding protein [Conexibacter woesei]|uniref:Extracellular solute-binding protein family 1 n=1 Tax=Conexibacter woesei (strain DSM 14684 / CCUG 47730 / CIP 108061 / JCM 11494 / NBRC 100937 / ID131577) TaxID=469383 RepID=D3F6C2_CONWI|nr:extracellular solute-binding protein [Conexibacter woesei]ADB50689.1 extracellular solute-binding protein family 1 [Conexibacter woesei DSM 14684]